MLDLGVEKGIIAKNGNSYAYGEEKLGVGRENAKDFLRQNQKLIAQIKQDIWQKVKEEIKK